MKKYNIANYVRWKNDVEQAIRKLPEVIDSDYTIYDRDQMITCFTPLVENLSRKFSTSQQASGVMSIMDLIQEGNAGLTQAVDRLDYKTLADSEDQEKTLKSFLSKRIRGAIRRAIYINRGDIRIPEQNAENEDMVYQIPDKSEPYNMHLLNMYLKSLMSKHLDHKEYEVLRLSYGLDCDKHDAKTIADILKIQGTSAYVRISQLKKQAVQTLIDKVDHSQVLDYL